ncbi:hypothetical protein [Dactylosporangium cerinum]
MLVVDGLDEDSYLPGGRHESSIAALLPTSPAAEMRIIVSSRQDLPLPVDVPGDHPLRDTLIVKALSPLPYAQVTLLAAKRELTRLLLGTSGEPDLLGLIATAHGGLSHRDLTELTGLPVATVNQHLTDAVSDLVLIIREDAYVRTPPSSC